MSSNDKQTGFFGYGGLLAALLTIAGAEAGAQSTEEAIKWKGDFRYRHEMIDAEGADERHRQRVRGRIGAFGQVSESVEAGARLASGGEVTSTNETLDGGFGKKDIFIDLLFATWKGESSTLTLGKMEIPFFRAAGNTLIWDSDVTPEGMAYGYARSLGSAELFFNAAGLWLDERSSESDAGILAGQLGAKAGADHKVTAGVSYLTFTRLQGEAALDGAGDGQGNTVDGGGNYVNDYIVLELFAEYAAKIAGLPVVLGASYINNSEADDNNAGYQANLKIGKTKEAGDWFFQVFYLELEADATLALIAESDPFGGGTDGKATALRAGYQAAKNILLEATYFIGQQGLENGTDFNRGQLDASFKF